VIKPKTRGVAKHARSDERAKHQPFAGTAVRLKAGKAGKANASRAKGPTARATTAKPAKKAVRTSAKKQAKAEPPELDFRVRELDPQRKCGVGTSVERLYRVDECHEDGSVRLHLVFLDRHGWYCEHGRNCPAVPHARRHGDRARQHGPTQNGRMRA
jgi:hypothetical protein